MLSATVATSSAKVVGEFMVYISYGWCQTLYTATKTTRNHNWIIF